MSVSGQDHDDYLILFSEDQALSVLTVALNKPKSSTFFPNKTYIKGFYGFIEIQFVLHLQGTTA